MQIRVQDPPSQENGTRKLDQAVFRSEGLFIISYAVTRKRMQDKRHTCALQSFP
jgi:hypothetical protein